MNLTEQPTRSKLDTGNSDPTHALCSYCYPDDNSVPQVAVAFCGTRFDTGSYDGTSADPFRPPMDACTDCMVRDTCATCGRRDQ